MNIKVVLKIIQWLLYIVKFILWDVSVIKEWAHMTQTVQK